MSPMAKCMSRSALVYETATNHTEMYHGWVCNGHLDWHVKQMLNFMYLIQLTICLTEHRRAKTCNVESVYNGSDYGLKFKMTHFPIDESTQSLANMHITCSDAEDGGNTHKKDIYLPRSFYDEPPLLQTRGEAKLEYN